MSNQINGLNGSGSSVGTGRSVSKARDAAVGGSSSDSAESSASSTGSVHITDSATRLAALELTLKQLPAVDDTKVAQFQSAIESGQYTVRPEHVADQLLATERQLSQVSGLTDAEASDQASAKG